eukprot:6201595-Pleurochrysis_carterae.AAC.1
MHAQRGVRRALDEQRHHSPHLRVPLGKSDQLAEPIVRVSEIGRTCMIHVGLTTSVASKVAARTAICFRLAILSFTTVTASATTATDAAATRGRCIVPNLARCLACLINRSLAPSLGRSHALSLTRCPSSCLNPFLATRPEHSASNSANGRLRIVRADRSDRIGYDCGGSRDRLEGAGRSGGDASGMCIHERNGSATNSIYACIRQCL